MYKKNEYDVDKSEEVRIFFQCLLLLKYLNKFYVGDITVKEEL